MKGMNMNNYESVYRNTGATPRTMRRVEDHYAVHTFKSEWDDAKEFFIGLAGFSLFIVMCLALGYGFMAWLELYK
jgi:hypothetical protein